MNQKVLKKLLLCLLISNQAIGWSTNSAITNPSGPVNLKSDFKMHSSNWMTLSAKDIRGKHEIFDIKNGKEHIFLYRVSPRAEMGIKEHDTWEEVIIINGTLEWLDATGHTQQTLSTGAYVDRPPQIKHGPFRAGNEGCLMYVRMHG
jgi:hypothetical protein